MMKVYTEADFPAPQEYWEWKKNQGIEFALKMMKKYGNITAMEMHKNYLEEWRKSRNSNSEPKGSTHNSD